MEPTNQKGKVKKTIWIPEEIDRAVKQAAKLEKETFSEFVRQAILSHLTIIDYVHKIKKEIKAERRAAKRLEKNQQAEAEADAQRNEPDADAN